MTTRARTPLRPAPLTEPDPGPSRRRPGRLPRTTHPVAWWIWALSLAAASSRTTNPLLLALAVAVVAVVVTQRRSDAPWARGFRGYLVLALVVVGIRVAFRIGLGGGDGVHELFRLPEIPLPEAAAGIRLGGRVTAEAVLAAVYDGMRLATLLLCVGAANVLADPKRLLKALPGALHEIGVAITVALTVAPQLVESAQRVRRARHLRAGPGTDGRGRRRRAAGLARRVLVPVLEDALDRSLRLAAAMDARGFGRAAPVPLRARRITSALVGAGVAGVGLGTYGVLDSRTPPALGAPALAVGLGLLGWGLVRSGRRVARSAYRPDPWAGGEWLVAGCGVVTAAALLAWGAADPDRLHPSLSPLRWPELPPGPALALLVATLPAWLAPPAPARTPALGPRGSRP